MKEGEGRLLLDQIREMTQDILTNLMEIDTRLGKLQETVHNSNELDKATIVQEISALRTIIGALEKEETEEIEDEKILESMVTKLNDLIEKTLG